jgi:RNA polymerase sigma-70 factor (ECF subfamily)
MNGSATFDPTELAPAIGAVSVTDPSGFGRIAMTETSPTATRRTADAESLAWLQALGGDGPDHNDAVERLHALLLRAATFEVKRRRGALDGGSASELDDLAMQAADDALMAVMRKLDSFRGDSRFTTWAYKFALLEAAVKVRRRMWNNRELPLEEEGWARLSDLRSSPHRDVESAELFGAVGQAIAEALTAHQRTVLISIALNDVPIDVLAERLGTTRGALYKTLHDARRKLRARLADDGHQVGSAFEGESL